MKAIRTDCVTGERKEVICGYRIEQTDTGEDVFYLEDGPTGYESFSITSKYTNLDRIIKNGWYACAGTPNSWDTLYVPGAELKKILAPYLETKEPQE
jgi:hypothetical protein